MELRNHLLNDCKKCLEVVKETNLALQTYEDGSDQNLLDHEATCVDCGFTKYRGHQCKDLKIKALDLLPEIKFCDQHQNSSKNQIPLERIVNIKDKANYLRVYFETLKCKMCNNLAASIYKCPNCSSFYCKDCMIYQKDPKLAIFSGGHPACKVCLYSFKDFPHALTTYDHFKIK